MLVRIQKMHCFLLTRTNAKYIAIWYAPPLVKVMKAVKAADYLRNEFSNDILVGMVSWGYVWAISRFPGVLFAEYQTTLLLHISIATHWETAKMIGLFLNVNEKKIN